MFDTASPVAENPAEAARQTDGAFLIDGGSFPFNGIPEETDPSRRAAHEEAAAWWRSDWAGQEVPRNFARASDAVSFRIAATILHAAISTGLPTVAFRHVPDRKEVWGLAGWNRPALPTAGRVRFTPLSLVPRTLRQVAGSMSIERALGRPETRTSGEMLHWLLEHMAGTGIEAVTVSDVMESGMSGTVVPLNRGMSAGEAFDACASALGERLFRFYRSGNGTWVVSEAVQATDVRTVGLVCGVAVPGTDPAYAEVAEGIAAGLPDIPFLAVGVGTARNGKPVAVRVDGAFDREFGLEWTATLLRASAGRHG